MPAPNAQLQDAVIRAFERLRNRSHRGGLHDSIGIAWILLGRIDRHPVSSRLPDEDCVPPYLLDAFSAFAMPDLVQTTNLRGH